MTISSVVLAEDNITFSRQYKQVVSLIVDGKVVDAKLCIGCKKIRPLTSFHVEAKGIGGRKPKCKMCRVLKSRAKQ